MNAGQDETSYRDVMNYIEYELEQLLNRKELHQSPKIGRVSRQLKHFPIEPEIEITKDDKGNFQLSIIAGDRPGLLARIAHVLTHHKIAISSAKINTLGARAEDTFWISGSNLAQPQSVAELKLVLKKNLS